MAPSEVQTSHLYHYRLCGQSLHLPGKTGIPVSKQRKGILKTMLPGTHSMMLVKFSTHHDVFLTSEEQIVYGELKMAKIITSNLDPLQLCCGFFPFHEIVT
jgi:hypothetical protein